MGRVLRKIFDAEVKGEYLKNKSDENKKIVRTRAYQLAKGSKSKNESYENYLVPFQNANDAVLEYIPHRSKSTPALIFANSSVSDMNNPFAQFRRYILLPKTQRYNVVHTNRRREINVGGPPREHDTEYKLLSYLSGTILPSTKGVINLYTYYEPCLSCDYVIIQFTRQFQDIDINIYYERKYDDTTKGGL